MDKLVDVKIKKMLCLLKWLENKKSVEIKLGGKHPIKVKCIHNGKSYPLPSTHSVIKKSLVKAFGYWLVENDICTLDEYKNNL